VADPGIRAELHEVLLREDLVDKPHSPLRLDLAVVDGDPGGLLAAMLEDPQPVVEVGRHGRRAGTTDDPALLLGAKVGILRRGPFAGHPQCLFAQEYLRSRAERPKPQLEQ